MNGQFFTLKNKNLDIEKTKVSNKSKNLHTETTPEIEKPEETPEIVEKQEEPIETSMDEI